MSQWFDQHPSLLWWLAALSGLMLLATVVLVPWLLARLPADYFSAKRKPPSHSRGRFVGRLLRNLAGYFLILLGILLLLLPGQGLLTLLIGVMLAEFPGRQRALRWLVSRPPLRRLIDRLRRRAGQKPLVV